MKPITLSIMFDNGNRVMLQKRNAAHARAYLNSMARSARNIKAIGYVNERSEVVELFEFVAFKPQKRCFHGVLNTDHCGYCEEAAEMERNAACGC